MLAPPDRLSYLMQRRPTVECVLTHVRERRLTLDGQKKLMADGVAICVSILILFRVTDPESVIHNDLKV